MMPDMCFRKVGRERRQSVQEPHQGGAGQGEAAQGLTQARERAGSGRWPRRGAASVGLS